MEAVLRGSQLNRVRNKWSISLILFLAKLSKLIWVEFIDFRNVVVGNLRMDWNVWRLKKRSYEGATPRTYLICVKES